MSTPGKGWVSWPSVLAPDVARCILPSAPVAGIDTGIQQAVEVYAAADPGEAVFLAECIGAGDAPLGSGDVAALAVPQSLRNASSGMRAAMTEPSSDRSCGPRRHGPR
jgi:hypothetical protein